MLLSIDVEHVCPYCLIHFFRYRDELEYEVFYPASGFQSELYQVIFLHQQKVEVAYHGSVYGTRYSRPERLWQALPSKYFVKSVKVTLLFSPLVADSGNLFGFVLIVVGIVVRN